MLSLVTNATGRPRRYHKSLFGQIRVLTPANEEPDHDQCRIRIDLQRLLSAGLNQIVLLWVVNCQVEVFLCEAPVSTAYLLEFVRGRPLIAFREISGFQPSLPELGGQNGKDSPSGFLLSTSAIACSAPRSICSTAATCLRSRAGNCTRCDRHSAIRLVPLDGFGWLRDHRFQASPARPKRS
jgi:hypothetical protein